MSRDFQKGRARVISIISGKGGCGKTLLTAVVGRALAKEGLRVLLIDFDIFVRGLSIFLADYSSGDLHTRSRLTISDILLDVTRQNSLDITGLAIFRFFECDVIPSSSSISAPLDYDQQQLSSFEFGKSVVEKILSNVRNEYDIILIDNRASIDSLVLAVCTCSDLIISVAEDDQLCLQTNSNLVNHLRYKRDVKNVYTLINKGRRVTSYDDLGKERWRRTEFNYIGVIPFDLEIMEDFGTNRFWRTIDETLYFRAVIDAWNTVAKMEGLKKIDVGGYKFPPSIFMSKKAGKYTTIERMMRIYSVVLIFMGILLFTFDKLAERGLSLTEVLSLVCIIAGLLILLVPSKGIRRWLLGKSD